MSDFLKEGWLKTRLGECCQILDSLRIPVSEIERAKRIGRYPYYGANGIQGYINDFIFEGPSVLLAEDGGYFDEYSSRPIAQYVTGKYWVNNHAHILKGKIGFDTKWIFYALVHKNILKYINSGTRAKLNQGDLREIELLAPPLKEQQKIAEILTSVDEVIENTQSQINKLEDLKKATMNELLTKGVGHTEFKDTEIGRIPKDWRIRSLEQLVDQNRPITYGIVQTGEHIPDGVPCIRVVDIVRMKPDINRMIRTTHDISNSYRRTILKTDDILFALRGEIGFVYKVNAYLEGANLTRGVALRWIDFLRQRSGKDN